MVVAIEMKLVAELHEAAGIPLPTGIRVKGPVIAAVVGRTAAASRRQDLVERRAGDRHRRHRRSSPAPRPACSDDRPATRSSSSSGAGSSAARAGTSLSFTPLLIGAAAGAALNRRATRAVGTAVAVSLGIPPPP